MMLNSIFTDFSTEHVLMELLKKKQLIYADLHCKIYIDIITADLHC